MINPAPTNHPIHTLLENRWSPRAYDPARNVEHDVALRILEAARWAPSSYNEQPWRLIVGLKQDQAQFNRVLQGFNEFNQSWAKSATMLIAACTVDNFTRNNNPNPHAGHDLGQALAHLTFQAEAEGLRVHQCAGILPQVWIENFGIPQGVTPLTGVVIGYQAPPETLPEQLREKETLPRQRKPLAETTFTTRYGEPADFLTQ